MSAVSAVSAAVRPPRSAAARRAVLTLLFLGGFLALAFLFGGSAQAATGLDGPKGKTDGSAAGLLKPEKSPGAGSSSQDELAEQHQAAEQAAGEAASRVIGPVAEGAGGAEEITRPVGETVEGVSDAAGLSGITERLGLQLGDGRGGSAPESDSGDEPGRGDDGPSADGADSASPAAGRYLVQRGSDGPAAASSHSAVRHAEADDGTSREGDGLPGHIPFQHVPAAPSAGASQFASDGNGSRGGPQQLAGYLTDVELFGLPQPGAVRAAADAPTRDRASEVLEFPG
ncbi:hypothetical protein ACFPA8_00910 [Streptomyces ovatisporus]|uniref:Secreted protein n=1 Tax=Streptomyces ovatisporus TaxID=1128682 RepID=A0ABV9A132_9ACTN